MLQLNFDHSTYIFLIFYGDNFFHFPHDFPIEVNFLLCFLIDLSIYNSLEKVEFAQRNFAGRNLNVEKWLPHKPALRSREIMKRQLLSYALNAFDPGMNTLVNTSLAS